MSELLNEVGANTQEDLQTLFKKLEHGAPFDVKEDFIKVGGFPEGFEVKSSPSFIYFLHTPCGAVLRKFADFVGPRGIVNSLHEHLASCSVKVAK